jgi:glycerophosphoryl diester phosphodiesterase
MGVIRVAHRGASAYAPENTISAFRKAIEIGVDCIELDVHICRSGEVIVMHDDTLDRTTNLSGKISEMTLEEIRRADAGAWFDEEFRDEPVPTLEEALEFIGDEAVTVVEVKDEWIAPQVVEIIERMKAREKVVVISFHPRVLKEIRDMGVPIPTGLLVGGKPQEDEISRAMRLLEIASGIGVGMISLDHHLVRPNLAYEVRRRGFGLWAWTVDEVDRMRKLIEIGVVGITSNRPDLLNQI